MDTHLESGRNEENSPEPTFQSIINAMGSKKEATADEIYKRIQQDGVTNYSKPQVDRALANALQYGIFEVRNNRYTVRDDVLDDEDTIYWQAHIKREKTPYRLENNQRGYINPEKDQHRFRKLYVSDGEGCNSCRKQTTAVDTKGGKRNVYNKKPMNSSFRSNRSVKNTGDQQFPRWNVSETGKVAAMKRPSLQKRKIPARQVAKTGEQKEAKKRKKDLGLVIPAHIYGSSHHHYAQDSDSDVSSKATKRKRKTTCYNEDYEEHNNEEEEEDEEEEDEEDDDEDDIEDEEEEEEEGDKDDDDDEDETIASKDHDNKSKCPHSSFFEYMKEPYVSNFLPKKRKPTNYPCDDAFSPPSIKGLPNENKGNRNRTLTSSRWNMGCKQSENFHIGVWCSKADWLVNRPQNTEDGTVKQLENALQIEPLNSLPFKNMEEPSYIS